MLTSTQKISNLGKRYLWVKFPPLSKLLWMKIEYECFYIELTKEISKRSEAEKYLEESEMWYLVYCLTSAAS